MLSEADQMKNRDELNDALKTLHCSAKKEITAIFDDCPDKVVRHAALMKLPAGVPLMREGQHLDYVYILLNGTADGIDEQTYGVVYIFREFGSGSILGDFEVLGEISEYRSTIVTSSDGDVLRIPAEVYLNWMSSDSRALMKRTRMLIKELTLEVGDKRKYALLSSHDKMLLYLCNRYKEEGNGREFRFRDTREKLAKRLGISVKTIGRNIKTLEEEGFIGHESGKITMDPEQYERQQSYISEHLVETNWNLEEGTGKHGFI